MGSPGRHATPAGKVRPSATFWPSFFLANEKLRQRPVQSAHLRVARCSNTVLFRQSNFALARFYNRAWKQGPPSLALAESAAPRNTLQTAPQALKTTEPVRSPALGQVTLCGLIPGPLISAVG